MLKDSEIMNPATSARYTIDVPYFFGFEVLLDIRGVVSLGWVVSLLEVMAKVVQHSEMEVVGNFKATNV
jgi:hypothetical protein